MGAVRLLSPYGGKQAGQIYVGDDSGTLLSSGLADNALSAASDYANYGGAIVKANDETRPASAISNVMAPIAPNRVVYAGAETDSVIVLNSDSTGFGTDRWVYRTTNRIAAARPDTCVLYAPWDVAGTGTTDVTRDYGPWQVLGNGAAGQRHILFRSTDTGTRQIQAGDLAPLTSGNLTVETDQALDNWQSPVAAGQTLAAQFGGAGNRAWRVYVDGSGGANNGKLTLGWSTDGTAETTVRATLANTFTPGQRVRVRASLLTNNGAGGYTWDISYSLDGGATWTSAGGAATSAGTTSIFATATQPWELGGRGQVTNTLGKFYEVLIRDGVIPATGNPVRPPVINPQPINTWTSTAGKTGLSGTFGGSTTLYVYNGARSGQNIAYFSDPVRFSQMVRPVMGGMFIANTGFNEGNSLGLNKTNLANWNSWQTLIRARLPSTALAMLTQNAAGPNSPDRERQAVRIRQQAAWGFLNGWTVFDTYRATMGYSLDTANYVQDGLDIHFASAPQQAVADFVYEVFNLRSGS